MQQLRESAVKLRARLVKGGANPNQLPTTQAIQSYGTDTLRNLHSDWTRSYAHILSPKPSDAASTSASDPLAGAAAPAGKPRNPIFEATRPGAARNKILKSPQGYKDFVNAPIEDAIPGKNAAQPRENWMPPEAKQPARVPGPKPGRTPLEDAVDRIPMASGILAGNGDPTRVRQTPTGMESLTQTSSGPRWVQFVPTLAQVMSAKTGGKWDNWTPDQRRMHLQGQDPDAQQQGAKPPGTINVPVKNGKPGDFVQGRTQAPAVANPTQPTVNTPAPQAPAAPAAQPAQPAAAAPANQPLPEVVTTQPPPQPSAVITPPAPGPLDGSLPQAAGVMAGKAGGFAVRTAAEIAKNNAEMHLRTAVGSIPGVGPLAGLVDAARTVAPAVQAAAPYAGQVAEAGARAAGEAALSAIPVVGNLKAPVEAGAGAASGVAAGAKAVTDFVGREGDPTGLQRYSKGVAEGWNSGQPANLPAPNVANATPPLPDPVIPSAQPGKTPPINAAQAPSAVVTPPVSTPSSPLDSATNNSGGSTAGNLADKPAPKVGIDAPMPDPLAGAVTGNGKKRK